MSAALGCRLGAVERRMGGVKAALAEFGDADLLGAMRWVRERLAEAGVASAAATPAGADAAEARSRGPEPGEGVRRPYRRARALRREREHLGPGPRSARTPAELTRKIGAAMATLRRAR
jgi:hypothetical protein